jgi:hypothetical protein
MMDRDIRDMFLNYQLHEEVRPYTAVDLTGLQDIPKETGPEWAVWDRNLMDFVASPYNPFQWEWTGLNLPGTKEYDPCVSWISKRKIDGQMVCNVFTFVNNERVVGPTKELTWQASHMLASKQSYLGIQEAARKARPCTQMTGAWAGAIVHVLDKLGVYVLTSREKWTKMRGILNKWRTAMREESPRLSHKELLADRGFLVYVTRTYPAMVPYLKGFHLTIEMWQGGLDAKGWKLKTGDDSYVASNVDLDKAVFYAPLGEGDEDEATADHQMASKVGG